MISVNHSESMHGDYPLMVCIETVLPPGSWTFFDSRKSPHKTVVLLTLLIPSYRIAMASGKICGLLFLAADTALCF